jgi:5-methyltetrahydrofolate--homocysteine methyltransferase
MELTEEISENLILGEVEAVAALVRRALDEGLAPTSILNDGLLAGMAVVGKRFKVHEMFLPDVLLAAKAMNAGMEILKPLLVGEAAPTLGRVVIGTVQGDLHDIGKTLVIYMLRAAGFEVVDLGKDVPPERFVEAALREEASVIGMSALLTTTMPVMKRVVDLVREQRLDVKVIVGGAPITRTFAEEIGADDYGHDAANAVERVKALVGAV